MYEGRFIFAQLMDFLPRHHFNQCVQKYCGNHRSRKFSCYDQWLCMAFAQLTYRASLRDTVTCMQVLKPKLYHIGVRGAVSRSTLAGADDGVGGMNPTTPTPYYRALSRGHTLANSGLVVSGSRHSKSVGPPGELAGEAMARRWR